MRNYRNASFVVVALAFLAVSASGQSKSKGTPAAVPAPTSAGKPDFSGIWQGPVEVGKKPGTQFWNEKNFSPLKPEGEALLYVPRTGDTRVDEPRDSCMPSGFPWGMLAGGLYPTQIVQTTTTMVIVQEFMRMTRIIPIDGRPHHPADMEPTYQGDSVGHWEGDTLVIDTNNFKRYILDDSYYVKPERILWHSDALHTIERFQRVDANTISYKITLDDPKIFTAPWSQDFLMTLRPDWDKEGLFEFMCEENNRCEGGHCSSSETKK